MCKFQFQKSKTRLKAAVFSVVALPKLLTHARFPRISLQPVDYDRELICLPLPYLPSRSPNRAPKNPSPLFACDLLVTTRAGRLNNGATAEQSEYPIQPCHVVSFVFIYVFCVSLVYFLNYPGTSKLFLKVEQLNAIDCGKFVPVVIKAPRQAGGRRVCGRACRAAADAFFLFC